MATCYARAGSAVTAEGLFQSSLDKLLIPTEGGGSGYGYPPCPVTDVVRRDAHLWYADLCSNWERRDGDASDQLERAEVIEGNMAEGWRGRPGSYGGLWMFNVGDFR